MHLTATFQYLQGGHGGDGFRLLTALQDGRARGLIFGTSSVSGPSQLLCVLKSQIPSLQERCIIISVVLSPQDQREKIAHWKSCSEWKSLLPSTTTRVPAIDLISRRAKIHHPNQVHIVLRCKGVFYLKY